MSKIQVASTSLTDDETFGEDDNDSEEIVQEDTEEDDNRSSVADTTASDDESVTNNTEIQDIPKLPRALDPPSGERIWLATLCIIL